MTYECHLSNNSHCSKYFSNFQSDLSTCPCLHPEHSQPSGWVTMLLQFITMDVNLKFEWYILFLLGLGSKTDVIVKHEYGYIQYSTTILPIDYLSVKSWKSISVAIEFWRNTKIPWFQKWLTIFKPIMHIRGNEKHVLLWQQ